MQSKKIKALIFLILSSFYTYSQQGAYHDAMIEENESGGQFPFFIGLIIILVVIYMATNEKQN